MATVLEANTRTDLRKSVSNKLRTDGYVPAVLYGKDTESKPVSVPNITFIKTIREVGRNGIIELDVEGESEKHKVIVHDIQVDPIKDYLVHIDFFEVDLKSEMEADVSVNLQGDAPGEKEGGILSPLLYNVTVRALPTDIPEEIAVDISELGIGDSVQIADLASGKGFEFVNEPEETVVTVLPPEQEKEPEEEQGQEPELVGADEEDGENKSE
ncbi:50S ribosomal protein L25/general stress protein Ctc [Salibacterium salarium]|uniref:Large ribosomal subunit protein bL25 n=1 Tax=Salibacterium salarium TaxID=284579 RepID=A0A428MV87_9BACI|nr:50S ribosomal protein L25/general stress protein Ctc [Salibacterium salarium]RSL30038.1 50S ribosomal protein L25/general stress protein Ctc [Salibacterium salarium]